MARFVLFSDDRELQRQLGNALGAEILLERTEAGAQQLLSSGASHTCILHLSAAGQSIPNRMDAARRMIHAGIDMFVVADKSLEWSAMEIVGSGAKGYCHNDGEFRTLKGQVLKTCSPSSQAHAPESTLRVPSVFAPNAGLIGSSSQIRNVVDMIRLVANLDAPVFIHGETGTGKEVIARAIHRSGSRAHLPFVAIPCGAIPEALLEAELFGHEKGAFTGTVGARKGSLEEAADGSVFFDEVGELSLSAQVKFLRVLQECEFQRLGSSRLIPMRARLIFATHQDLDSKVAAGAFRQDLLYRIDVVRITVPPLRDRPEDIPLLSEHFLQVYSKKFGIPRAELGEDAEALLKEYAWPGNVRELEHVIQSAMIMSHGEVIRLHHLPPRLRRIAENVLEIDGHAPDGSFEEQLANFKLKLAQAAVKKNHGNKTLAARSLNISRPYLHRLLRIESDEQFPDESLGAFS